MKVKGYVVDSNKISGSYAQRNRGNYGSYGFIGKPKSKNAVGCYRPQGAFIPMKTAKKYNLNNEELIKVEIDKKDLVVGRDFDGKNPNYFAGFGKKYKIIEKGYSPNRYNKNNYIFDKKDTIKSNDDYKNYVRQVNERVSKKLKNGEPITFAEQKFLESNMNLIDD